MLANGQAPNRRRPPRTASPSFHHLLLGFSPLLLLYCNFDRLVLVGRPYRSFVAPGNSDTRRTSLGQKGRSVQFRLGLPRSLAGSVVNTVLDTPPAPHPPTLLLSVLSACSDRSDRLCLHRLHSFRLRGRLAALDRIRALSCWCSKGFIGAGLSPRPNTIHGEPERSQGSNGSLAIFLRLDRRSTGFRSLFPFGVAAINIHSDTLTPTLPLSLSL